MNEYIEECPPELHAAGRYRIVIPLLDQHRYIYSNDKALLEELLNVR